MIDSYKFFLKKKKKNCYNLPIFAWGGGHLCVLFLSIHKEELRSCAIAKVIALCNTTLKG